MFAFQQALNERQREAATFTGGPLRVLAGPGTGKTTTLAARVDVLLERGVPPERILLLTFTRRAAREVISRVRAARGDDRARRVSGGTFHSMAHRTLRLHAVALGLPEGFGVIDQVDAADLMDLVRGELGVVSGARRLPKKTTLASLYSRVVNTATPLGDVMREVTPWCADVAGDVSDIFSAFVARKRSLGLLDFDDLLLFWRAAVRDERLGKTLSAAYDHILVDEFQDVNRLQWDVLVGLRRDDPRLTLIGDDAQAIYGFRGASARFLLDAPQYIDDLTTISLDLNYRSCDAVLRVANAVAADAPEGFFSVLREATPITGVATPVLEHCADERHQSERVADHVLELYEQGVALRHQAVLFRAAHHSADLELELTRRRIPFIKYGGLRYLEAAHVKDLLAAFRLADNPRDAVAWFRLLQRLPGVGPAKARRAIDALRDDDGHLPTRHAEVEGRWPRVCDALPRESHAMSSDLANALHARTGEPVELHAERIRQALAPLILASYDDPAPRLEDLGALVLACAGATRLSDVAADQTLEPPASTGDLAGPPLLDDDWLVLSTVHSAKGLEFDAVHVIHAADGNFPSDMSLATPEGLEEERRLFYVAVTRARRDLRVYVPLRYHHHRVGDDHSWAQPSRFLSTAVRATMTEIDERPGSGEPGATTTAPLDGAALVADELAQLW